ncbi:MAG: NADH-quinone oxidoreductase subunit L [Acidobacteria bacterium]|nr:MAG: NADH-quinone oxidoreductase subunit L [Acidobacteriota bacterium]
MASHGDVGAGHEPAAGHGAPHGPDRTPWIVAVGWVTVLVVSVYALRDKPDAVPFIILLLPLLGFAVLCVFGDSIRDQGESNGAAILACCTVGTSFLFGVASVLRLLGLPTGPTGLRFTQPYLGFDWLAAGDFRVPANLLLDNLSAVMVLVVAGVGSLIHIYSVGYMAHDEDKVRYFSYLNLFTFFMLLLVLGGNLPLMFVGWEGVGLCSYLLIGFWFKKKSASDAGKKAFIVNRIGDAGLILGMILAFHRFGTVDLVDLATNAAAMSGEAMGHLGPITALCLLLFLGACGKSAQIPLHVWLPDAMEGPTPVSALIHAATMVTAGVYMVARLAPLFSLSPTAMAVVALVGTATAVLGATIALVQTDIKKVLAYSTVSQLGYMFLACGVGAFGVAIFHLFTHAFFKALLFLGSGSVIHATGGEQDMRKMGGLWRRIPWTFGTFVIGTAAIAGIPFLAGFYSKDAILAGTLAAGKPILFALALAVALLTAFYMTRAVVLTFFGSYRGDPEVAAHVHESPWVMVGPLVVLAIGAIVGGYIDIPDFVAPAFRLEAGGHEAHHAAWLPIVATLAALTGIGIAIYMFLMRTDLPQKIYARTRAIARILEAKYGFDLLYDWIAARVVVEGSDKVLWRGLDVRVIDAAVNGIAAVTAAAARSVRVVQTGLVRAYALVILGGAVALLSYLLWMR